MAANVETMFSVREKPWHGLGVVVEDAPSSKDALNLAGLDWRVVQKPLFTNSGLVEGYKANVRDSDNSVAITVVDILNGAAYLFDQKPTVNNKHWKSDLELEDFRNSLGLATKSKSNC